MKKFNLSYVVQCELTVDDLWPDGDAPEEPTKQHVLELIRRDGGILEVLNGWALHENFAEWDIWEVV